MDALPKNARLFVSFNAMMLGIMSIVAVVHASNADWLFFGSNILIALTGIAGSIIATRGSLERAISISLVYMGAIVTATMFVGIHFYQATCPVERFMLPFVMTHMTLAGIFITRRKQVIAVVAFSLAAILGHLIVGADREQIDVVSWLSSLTFAVIAAAGALVFQRLRDRLTTSIDEAERNADARQQFLSNMSHEIRTPLSGVVGLMEILATEPGVGTRFKVALPLPRTTTAPPAAQAAPRVEDSPALRVLVAEDERINALVVERHLKELGHSVTHVWDGYAAVAEYRNGSHDIVLMDAQMPKMDGTEATRLIREHEKSAGGVKQRIPILALTAYATQADHARIRAAEVDDILVKPVSRAELAEAIARHRSSARYRAS